MTLETFGVALLGVIALAAVVLALARIALSLRWILRIATSRGDERGLASPPRRERVFLRGRVDALDLVDSPLSDARGVYVRAQREAWRAGSTSVQVGGAFHVIDRVEEAAPFRIVSSRASILVDPAQCTVELPGRTWLTDDGMRCTETVLAPGTDVIVIGRVADEGGFEPSAGYRGHTTRPVVSAGKHGLRILAVRSFLVARALGVGAWLALGTLALGVTWGTMLWIGNHHPIITMDLPGRPTMRVPHDYERYRVHLWQSRRPEGAEVVGPVRIEIWVLGGAKESHAYYGDAESLAFARACDAFWDRQLDGLSPYRERRRREWLVFEVIEWSGTAFHEPANWEHICLERPWYCAAD